MIDASSDDILSLLSIAENHERNLQSWSQIEQDLAAARELLDELDPAQREESSIKIDINERRIRRERNNRIDNTLSRLSDDIQLDQFDAAQIRSDLEAIKALTITDEQRERVENLRNTLVQRQQEILERSEYERLQTEVDRLFEQAAEARERSEAGGQVNEQMIVSQYFLKAFTLAQDAAGRMPDSQLIKRLRDDVEARYNEARRQAELLTTALQMGQYQELLDELSAIMQRDPSRMVEKINERGINEGKAPVSEVILFVEERAYEATSRKVREEYQPQAQEFLDDKNPRAAFERMESIKRLRFLSDATRLDVQDFIDTYIMPDLNKLQEAEQLLDDARYSSDLHGAMSLVSEAKKVWPDTPNLDTVEQELIVRMQRQGERLAQDANEVLQRLNIERARAILDEAQAFTGYDAALESLGSTVNRLLAEAEMIEREIADAPTVVQEVSALLDNNEFTAAEQKLRAFEARYPNAFTRQPELAVLRDRVDARLNVEALATRAADMIDSGNVDTIQQVVEAAHKAIEVNASEANAFDLPVIVQRLECRYHYLLGEQAWHTYDAEKARTYLSQAVNNLAGRTEDIDAARDLLEKIRTSLEQESAIVSALEQVDSILDDGYSQQELLKAFHVLMPYSDLAMVNRGHFDQLFNRVSDELEQTAVATLQAQLDSDAPVLEVLEQQWEYLTDLLQSSQVRTLERPVRLAMSTLRGRQAFALEQWEDATNHYRVAVGLAPQDGDLLSDFREARRCWSRDQIKTGLTASELDFDAMIAVARSFERDEPYDPEPRLLMAEILLMLARSSDMPESARNTLDDAFRASQAGLQLAKQDTPEQMRRRLESLNDEVKTGRDLVWRMIQASEKLRLNRRLKSFNSGVQTATEVLDELTDYQGLIRWWSNERSRLISQLSDQLKTVQADDYWERFSYFTKIAVLDPENEFVVELQSVATHYEELFVLVEDVASDRTGAHVTDQDTDDLDAQIAYTQTVDRWVADLEEASEIELVNVPAATLEACERAHSTIGHKLQELRQIDTLYRDALFNANAARRTESRWEQFEAVLNEIDENGYGSHIIVGKLRDYQDHVREHRAELLEWQKALQKAVANEHFSEALAILDRLEGDEGDAHDEYGILTRVRVEDPFQSGRTTTGSRAIRRLIQDKEAQVNLLAEWLAPLLDPGYLLLFHQRAFPEIVEAVEHRRRFVPLGLESDTRIGTASQTIDHAERYKNASDFAAALEVLSPEMRARDNGERVPLQHALTTLHEPPITADRVISYRAAALLRLAAQIEEEVREEIAQLDEFTTKVAAEQQTFESALEQFDDVMDRLVSGKVKKTVREQLVDQAHAYHEILLNIAPEYTGIMLSASDYPVLRKG